MTQLVELSGGAVHYRDSGGPGPVLLFVHGLFTDGRAWEPLVDALGPGFRCVRPDLPLGAHTLPMRRDADQSPPGVARLVGELIAALDLHDVTVVATDTGGAITQLLLAAGTDRVARVVLTPCDSFENFPPRSLLGLKLLGRVPALLAAAAQVERLPLAQRITFRWLVRTPLPADLAAAWVRPIVDDRRIRADLARFLATMDRRATLEAAETLREFDRPVLLVWPRTLPYFPFAHAERWLRILPDARLVEVPLSYTLVCRDQPLLLAEHIARFVEPAEVGS